METTKRGKLIVFYGINNLGKTTQAEMTIEALAKMGIKAEYLKYGIYSLEPSGTILNDYLRKGNTYDLSPREFQLVHVINRTQYQATLEARLNEGTWIIAEDYTWTGIAWGMGDGVDKAFLEKINSHLLPEDLAILFDGERFMSGVEKNHKHESDAKKMEKLRGIHLELGTERKWPIVQSDQAKSIVQQHIMDLIEPLIEE
ncbi:MAG: hypothetical protein WCO66_00010 [Candidatus Absconditabacteria bacterium]